MKGEYPTLADAELGLKSNISDINRGASVLTSENQAQVIFE